MPYNPWAAWPITGSWANHASYSLGGEDYPLPYGTPLRAPAAGTLRTVGGSGEFKAGQVGSAGRRSILELDRPIRDVVAVVVQHQSEYGDNGRHYTEGESAIGWSGASANGSDWGGDVHLHVHCLTAGGSRRKFTDYFVTATYPSGPASGPSTPIEEDDMFTDEDRARQIRIENELNNTKAGIWSGGSALIDGKVQKFNYGVLPIVVHNQNLIAQLMTRIAALEAKTDKS